MRIIFSLIETKKLKISVKLSNIKNIISSIKDSFIYFLSNVATTSFNALSTIIIGIYIIRYIRD